MRRIGVIEHAVECLDAQSPALGHGVARIDRQVQERVLQLTLIDIDQPQAGGIFRFDIYVFAQRLTGQLFKMRDNHSDVGEFRRQGLFSRESKQTIGKIGAALRCPLNRLR